MYLTQGGHRTQLRFRQSMDIFLGPQRHHKQMQKPRPRQHTREKGVPSRMAAVSTAGERCASSGYAETARHEFCLSKSRS